MSRRPALASSELEMTKEGIEDYLSSLSGSFMNGLVEQVVARVKWHILRTARFFVCTAASAVKLPMRVEYELDGLEDLQSPLEDSDEDGLGGIVSQLASVSIRARTYDDQKSAVMKLLDFKHVVLDEAGAMLEPDMVVCFRAFPHFHCKHLCAVRWKRMTCLTRALLCVLTEMRSLAFYKHIIATTMAGVST
jgi:hypothetical protein